MKPLLVLISPAFSALCRAETQLSETKACLEHDILRGYTGRCERGEALQRAAIQGRVVEVQVLLAQGANVSAPNEQGLEALHCAALQGQVEVVQELLASGADVDARDRGYQASPLHFAAASGHVELLRALLAQGADIRARDVLRREPLHWATESCHAEAEAAALFLLKRGADAMARMGSFNNTVLHLAAVWGPGPEMVQLLLEQEGLDVEVRNKFGMTPLLEAASGGRTENLRFLLKRADWKARDAHGRTALHLAAGNGHLAAVRLLLEKGLDVQAQDELGRTSLHEAAFWGHLEAVPLLLEKGLHVEAHDDLGRTPLHEAAERGHERMVHFLLELGADCHERDEAGFCASDLAEIHGHSSLARHLPCSEVGWPWLKHAASEPRFWLALGLAALLSFGSACCLGKTQAGYQPEEPVGARLLAVEAVYPPAALLAVRLYRAAEVFSHTVLPMMLMLQLSPPLWLPLLLLLSLLPALTSPDETTEDREGEEDNREDDEDEDARARLRARARAGVELDSKVSASPGSARGLLPRAGEDGEGDRGSWAKRSSSSSKGGSGAPAGASACRGIGWAVSGSQSGSQKKKRRALEALMRRPMLLLPASRQSLLRLQHWQGQQLLGLLWAPGRLGLLLALWAALATEPGTTATVTLFPWPLRHVDPGAPVFWPELHLDSLTKALGHGRGLWCNARGQAALQVTNNNFRYDLCLPLPDCLSWRLQRLLWRWRARPPWEIVEGNCTLDASTFCIQHAPPPQQRGMAPQSRESCGVRVPLPATFRLQASTPDNDSAFGDLVEQHGHLQIGLPYPSGPAERVPLGNFHWSTLPGVEGRGWQICPSKRLCLAFGPVALIWRFLVLATATVAVGYAVASLVMPAAAVLARSQHFNSDCDEAASTVTSEICVIIKSHPAPEHVATAISEIKGSGKRSVQPTSVQSAALFLLLDLLLDLNTIRILLSSNHYMFAAIITAASIGSTAVQLQHGGFSEVRTAIDETRRTGVPTAAYMHIMGSEQAEAWVSLLVTSYSMAFSVRSPLDILSTVLSLLSSSWSLSSYLFQELDVGKTRLQEATASETCDSDSSDVSSTTSSEA